MCCGALLRVRPVEMDSVRQQLLRAKTSQQDVTQETQETQDVVVICIGQIWSGDVGGLYMALKASLQCSQTPPQFDLDLTSI